MNTLTIVKIKVEISGPPSLPRIADLEVHDAPPTITTTTTISTSTTTTITTNVLIDIARCSFSVIKIGIERVHGTFALARPIQIPMRALSVNLVQDDGTGGKGRSDNGIISRKCFGVWVELQGGEAPWRQQAKYIYPRQPLRENVKTTWPTPVILPATLCVH
ncbi:hypothetical protein HZH68_006354 [Vespula germanica]|uniref:Uncharacterized protein n=1 Tax=Vespula germanica TaxID=30212 RepID=A0A834NB71_VESGE|nr:hypothetical protein HZH68_006354 [Vespula germanica]